MDDSNLNHLDSVLSYVAGKATKKDDTLREREAGSWLLMATDLVPFSPGSMNPNQQVGGIDGMLYYILSWIDHFETNAMGWDATNPYEDSMLSNFSLHLPDSSADTNDDLIGNQDLKNDSIESFTLPGTAFPHPSPFPYSDTLLPNTYPANQNTIPVIKPNTMPLAPPVTSLRQQSCTSDPQYQYILPSTTRGVSRKRISSTTNEIDNNPLSQMNKENEEKIKKQKRLEKNREIAKNCRKRKKERREALEEEITHLREENSRIRIQLRDDTDDIARNVQRGKTFAKLKEELECHNMAGVRDAMKEYINDWDDFGKKRLTMAEFHLEQLKTLILPSQVTKMCMWSMQQGDDFFDERLNEIRYGGGIWNLIASKLKLTPDQRKAILRSRSGTVQQQENVAEVLDIVDKVHERMINSMNSMKEQLQGIEEVLTPEQQVNFLLWMENVLKEPRTMESIFMILKKRIQATDTEGASQEDESS